MRFISLLLIIFITSVSFGQTTSDSSRSNSFNNPLYEISLLTCGTGEELYSAFGHTAIKVKNNVTGVDKVYNYGTFSFREEGFYRKFTLGKLNYWLGLERFDQFLSNYKEDERSIKQQVLNLSDEDAQKIVTYLDNNAKEDNKYYQYDFIYDNCATRVRDVFTMALGHDFEYGPIIRGNTNDVTFRQALNQYLLNAHWTRLGINLILGSGLDENMTDEKSMFLPDFLFEGTKGAIYKGQPFVKETIELAPEVSKVDQTFNGPFWMTFAIFILTLVVFNVPALRSLKKVISTLILLTTGLLGFFFLFMWFGTDHQACNNNWNILWALPTNLIITFLIFKKKEWFKIYSLAAISALIVSLIIHAIGIQLLPLTELIPLFGTLLFIYMDLYKDGLSITALKATQSANE